MRGKFGKSIMAINLLVIIAGCIINSRIRQEEIKFYEIPVYSWDGETGYYNCIDESFQGAKFWFAVKTGELAKGIYRVHVNYETDITSGKLQFFTSGKSFIKADQLMLEAGSTELVQEIWINKSIDYMDISIDRPNEGYLKLESISLSRCITRSFTYEMLKLAAFLMVLDIICLLIKCRQKLYDRSDAVLGFTCIILASSIGVFTQSLVMGHDMWFHLGRIEGLADGLLSGVFPVRIQPSWLDGYGYAVSVMYGEALLYVPAILRAMGMPLQYAFKCYQLLVSILTVFISYYCFLKISKDKYIALTGSAIYSLSIYRTCDVYLRAAVGEYTAMLFFPFILLGTWELMISEEEGSGKTTWLYLTVGFSGLIQTHVLSCEMVGLYMIFVCFVCFKKLLRKKTIMIFCKIAVTVILVNLWFLIPFLEYTKEDFKVFVDGGSIQQTGLTLYQLFSVNASAGWAYWLQTRNVQLSLGIAVMMVLIASCFLMTKRIWEKKEKRIFAGCLFFVGLSCFMSTVYFPWDTLADMNSLFCRLIVTIEFSWRFMAVATLFIALLAVLLFMKLKKKYSMKLLKRLAVIICIMSAYQSLEYTDMAMRETENRTLYDGLQIMWDSAVSDQGYYYKKDIPLNLLSDKKIKSDILVFDYEKNDNNIVLRCEADENGYIECPLYYYPHYHASDIDSCEEFEVYSGNNGKLTVNVPKGYNGVMEITFREPWYWRGAELVSGCTIILLAGYVVRCLKKDKSTGDKLDER